MTETLETNEDLLDPEVQDLERLEKEIRNTGKLEKSDQQKNPYKEMIEKQKGPITHGNKENPEISITFDDGYGSENINHILDTLKGSGIKATFFVLGDCLMKTPDLWKKAAEQGHQICCHTFSHIYLSSNSDTTRFSSNLNKEIDINKRKNNVKTLLGNEYYEKIQTECGEGFPSQIKSSVLLRTEILMWEEQIKITLGNEYLQNLKHNYPFFRFPGGCGAERQGNIAVLKELGYLAIGWSDDFYYNNRKHMSVDEIKNMNIQNGAIPLFHFKKSNGKGSPSERDCIDAYIENMKNRNKTSHEVSRIIK